MNEQWGCCWKSGGSAGVSRYEFRFSSFLNKTAIITDHCAASQSCSFGKNHLSGNKLGCIFTAGAICNRPSKPKSTFCFHYLNNTDITGDSYVSTSLEHILDIILVPFFH